MLVEDGIVKLGPWLPDLPFFNNPGLIEAKNTLPVDGAYSPMNSLVTTSDALITRPLGAYAAIDTGGDPEIYAGTQSALLEKSASVWVDRSGSAYATADIGYWRFAQFDNYIAATNYNDVPQFRTISSADVFADLADTGTAPRARQIGVIGRFIMLGDIDDGFEVLPSAVQWSAINAPRDWPTPNTIAARTVQSGQQRLNSAYGAVTAIANGQFYGLIFQQRGVTRFTYTGGDAVFQVQEIDRTRGCWAPQSMIQVGSASYFVAVDGFYMTDGQAVVPIGNAKVDKWFNSFFDHTFRERVTASFDYTSKCILWSFPSGSATEGSPDRLIAYNVIENRWSWGELGLQMLFQSYSEGFTLDELDAFYATIDDITISLDSSFWKGGSPTIMGFSGNQIGTLSGAALDARFETGESEQNPFGYTFIRGVRPIVTGSPTSIRVSLAARSQQDTMTRSYSTPVERTTRTGVCDFRKNGRFVSARLEVIGGFERAIELGVDLEISDQV